MATGVSGPRTAKPMQPGRMSAYQTPYGRLSIEPALLRCKSRCLAEAAVVLRLFLARSGSLRGQTDLEVSF
jgi:hypothetical protein